MVQSVEQNTSQAIDRETSQSWLVPSARRSVSIVWAAVVPVFGAVYATVGLLHPIYGESPLAVAVLALLAMLTFGYAVMAPNGDILDPMRVVSVYFLIIFCLAPLAAREVEWHYTEPYVDLLPGAVLYSAAAYVLFVVGYHLPIFGRLPSAVERHDGPYSRRAAAVLGIVYLGLGLFSWAVLVFLAGGIDGLVYSDRARGEFFYGFGFFFWAALFMFPGSTLYWASRCDGRSRAPWIHALPLVLAFLCFLILQGRMRALNFLILGIFVAHYLIRPIKPFRLGIFALAGMLLALFIGIARAPSTRVEAFLNPLSILSMILENFDSVVLKFLASDLSRLRQISLILDKVPEWMPYDWGRSFILFMNPVFRLFGLSEFSMEGIGPRLFRLARPGLGPLPTGYLPSFPGEMIVNFPWPIASLFFIPYGVALRWIYHRLIVLRGDFIAIAVYSIILLQGANIMLQSFGHVVFEMLVVLTPLGIAHVVCRRGTRVARVGN